MIINCALLVAASQMSHHTSTVHNDIAKSLNNGKPNDEDRDHGDVKLTSTKPCGAYLSWL